VSSETQSYPKIRWYNSLILRVIGLCVILALCLLGTVYEISRHYFREVVQEMETYTTDIASEMTLRLEETPTSDPQALEEDVAKGYDGTALQLTPYSESVELGAFMLEKDPSGKLVKVARVPISVQGKPTWLLTVRWNIVPQTEILRAFKNKFLAALAIVFLVAISAMVYFIAKLLRPLTELSASCSQISTGTLADVNTGRNSGEILALEYTFNKMVSSLREKETVETNLRQAQRLSAIGNLAAGVAHDIRNPLNAIKLLSSHAIDSLGDVPEAEAAVKHMRTIRSEVNRLEEIVSGFLSLARERELCREPYRVDGLLEECIRLVRNDAEARGVAVSAELRAGGLMLMLDPKQMTRAILNVLINAMEASLHPGGRVRVFSRVTDSTCEIEVRDNGPGISKEIAERVFEAYFTTKTTGTGLGLSITRGIVEEHDGSIKLISMEKQGCQVLISLPLKSLTAPPPQ
jgi:signal transduction histidine kinase